MPTSALTNATVFTGEMLLDHHTVLISGGQISDVLPDTQFSAALRAACHTVEDLDGQLLSAGLIDLQVYGGGGALFSSHPNLATLENLYAHNLRHGTTGFLATLPTSSVGLMEQSVEAALAFHKKHPHVLFGLHLEGPFLSPAKLGAHPEKHVQTPDLQSVKYWIERSKGILKMLTIAPECTTPDVLALGRGHGVVFSAGHSNATYAEAWAGFENGCTSATHLFNAMSQLGHRAPGLVGAIFDHPAARASVIADGVHVDFAAIRIAKRLLGERLFLITDAVDDTGTGTYQFFRRDNYYVNADGVLGGSALTLPQAVHNCVEHHVCSREEAIRMATLYPAQVLGVEKQFGRVAVGCRADLCVWGADGSARSLVF